MATFNVHNIDWDTSDFSEEDELATGICVPDLPADCEIEAECEDDIADILADSYGFCVNSFTYDDPDYEDDFGNYGEGNAARHDLRG